MYGDTDRLLGAGVRVGPSVEDSLVVVAVAVGASGRNPSNGVAVSGKWGEESLAIAPVPLPCEA
jgi:hypothetical protein